MVLLLWCWQEGVSKCIVPGLRYVSSYSVHDSGANFPKWCSPSENGSRDSQDTFKFYALYVLRSEQMNYIINGENLDIYVALQKGRAHGIMEHSLEVWWSILASVTQAPWGGSTFKPSTMPGKLMLCICNRQGGLTPDHDRDADWLSGQLWNKI